MAHARRTGVVGSQSALEQAADLTDVQVLEVAARLAALLQEMNEVQRCILVIRGRIAVPTGLEERLNAVAAARARLERMRAHAHALSAAIDEAARRGVALDTFASHGPVSGR